MSDWAIATTPANAEHLVSADLARAGYEHHFFKHRVTRARRGQLFSTYRPAFPRYVLVRFSEAWSVLADVWRVLGLVVFGECVAKIRECDVERLVARCGGGDVLPPEEIPELYARGERVHVGGIGLISGHDAVYECTLVDGKIRVAFEMMGRAIPVDVDARDVSTAIGRSKRHRGRRRKRRAPELAADRGL